MEPSLGHSDLIYAFNEWLRRYMENPDEFEHEWSTIQDFINEGEADDASYGKSCTTLLFKIIAER